MSDKSTTSRRDEVKHIVPKLVETSRNVLFGDIWERPQLSKRDRSIATIAIIATNAHTDQLRLHIAKGLEHGLTEEELGELFTHIAFYAGWPAAMAAAHIAKDIFSKES